MGAQAAAASGAAAESARAASARWRRLRVLCMADAYGGPARSARDEMCPSPPERAGDCSAARPVPCSAAAHLMSDVAAAPRPDKPEPILFATAARGTEGAVRDELRELGFRGVRADRGGVHFGRSLDEGFRACTRAAVTALRVLVPPRLVRGAHRRGALRGRRRRRLAARTSRRATPSPCAPSATASRLTHSQFVAQKTKDAVVDQLRARLGARPSVDLDDPDVTLFVHLARDRATVYLDVSGGSLHRRGWRARAGDAPLKESLAAADPAALRVGSGAPARRPDVRLGDDRRSRRRSGRAASRPASRASASASSAGPATTRPRRGGPRSCAGGRAGEDPRRRAAASGGATWTSRRSRRRARTRARPA